MERWREYFKDLLEGHNTNENKSEQKRNKQIKQIQKDKIESEITQDEIKEAISKSKAGKAPRHDKITSEMMKALLEEALEEIRQIMNLVMKEGHAPEDWKTGIITPIFKKRDSK